MPRQFFAISSEDFTVIENTAPDVPPTPTVPDPSTIEGRVTALETSQGTQGTEIAAHDTKITDHDTEITDLETSQATQDAKIAAFEAALETANIAVPDTGDGSTSSRVTALETSQGTQDTKITDLETRHDTEIAALEAKIAAFVAALETAGIDVPDTGGGGSGTATTIYNVPGVSASARVYPNPAKHSLLFANLTPGRVYLYKIYTSSGVLLRSDAVQSDEAIDISALEAGQHLLVLQDDDSREVLRSSLLIE